MGRGSLPVRQALRAATAAQDPTRREVLRSGLQSLGASTAVVIGSASLNFGIGLGLGLGLGLGFGLGADVAQAQSPTASSTRRFTGRATHAETGQWLYTEEHQQVLRDGRWWGGTIRYVSPTGELLAEKTLDFSQDRFIPLARTVFKTGGVEERITKINPQSVTMETVREGRTKTREVERSPVMAADSGFHAFIQARLEDLLAGQTVNLAFGVISQQTTFKFRIRRTAQRTVGTQRHVVLVAEPDSLLRLVADPLTLVYDERTRDLLEYQGLSNLDDPATGKPPKVRITYQFADA